MFVLVGTAAALDIFYYDQLLRGAVDALLEFERSHPEIQMSTLIERRVGHGRDVVYWAYGLMIFVLGSFAIWSWRDYGRERNKPQPNPVKTL